MEHFHPRIPPRLELWERVLEALRTGIVRGDLPAGTRLVEAQLAERLGVSGGPVRDALRQLEYEGLVETRARRGKVVVGMSERDIAEIYELRTHLEVLAARRAVERGEGAGPARLQRLVDRMREALALGAPGTVAEPDIAFHRELVRLADHRRLLVAWEALAPTTKTLLTIADALYVDMGWAVDQHQKIVDALRAGDTTALEALVRTHTARGERTVVALLQSRAWGGPSAAGLG
ncbi:MAG TPA: GntR family transcriptional regulator [Chloroflexota bacterium]|jgi:GntR family transcriptional regulator of gluconate operon|nr:GntR family transcriptional regulator [Chloroflexota bacterium]